MPGFRISLQAGEVTSAGLFSRARVHSVRLGPNSHTSLPRSHPRADEIPAHLWSVQVL
jgi:hypothetical protein